MSASLIRMVGEYLFSQKVREEQRYTLDLAQSASSYMQLHDALGLYTLSVDAAQESGRVLILDMYGVVQADTLAEYNGRRLELYEVERVLGGEGSAYGFYNDESDQPRRFTAVNVTALMGVYAAPIPDVGDDAGGTLGAVVYMTDSQAVYDSLTQMQSQMAIWLVLVALAVVLLSILISRIFTKPIGELNRGIERMTGGDLTSRVLVRGHNEFAQLAEAFNMMCQRLESLDQTRNQFVSNASHELKTPLSAMKILVETLVYQTEYDPVMQKEFLTDINGEIDRLNSIVGDLLTLVHFDSGKVELALALNDLGDILTDTIRRLKPIAEKRDIEMELAIRDDIATMCDRVRLQQVFYNLLDNAIKYTPDGGRVTVEMTRVGRKAVLRFQDTGIGIPKADLIHVFDRFYRVDKARARTTGGTGLGLSIVKQIVMLHEGTITVASEEDKGSVFTVTLPIINLTGA